MVLDLLDLLVFPMCFASFGEVFAEIVGLLDLSGFLANRSSPMVVSLEIVEILDY